MVEEHLGLAVLPAQPDHLAFDAAVEVEEANARILEDRAELFDLLPARAILLDAAHELALHLADVVRVGGVEHDAIGNVAELAAEAREELLDAGAAVELAADHVLELGDHRVDPLDREDAA